MPTDPMETISKLLVQAERAGTEKEADTFFEKAQDLASKYSVELEKARQLIENREMRENPVNKRITIGEPKKPLNAVFCSLMMAIGRPQGITFNIAHNSTYVIAFGFPSDIRIMEAMYAHISVQMIEEANAFIKAGSWRGDTTWDQKTWSYKPTHPRVARRCFYEAFTNRIEARLNHARRETERKMQEADEAAAAEAGVELTASTSTALAIKGKDVEVKEFYKKASTARGSWKGGNNTYTSSSGSSAGASAGDRARLGGQQSIGTRKAIS